MPLLFLNFKDTTIYLLTKTKVDILKEYLIKNYALNKILFNIVNAFKELPSIYKDISK